MNESSYFSGASLNKQVLVSALIAAYKNLLWPLVCIGLPMIIFGLNGTLLDKTLFGVAITFGSLIPYFCLCCVLHKYSLKTKKDEEEFYALSPKKRGKVIGDQLSGWW
jgi:hypothetical protein